jgi:hypothetical protein
MFIVTLVEFPKRRIKKSFRDPNWEAARNHIKNLSEFKLAKLICKVDELHNDDYRFSQNGTILGIKKGVKTHLKKRLLGVIEVCREMWEGSSNEGMLIELRRSIILVSAGQAYKDVPDACRDIRLFYVSGASKAAGFYESYLW